MGRLNFRGYLISRFFPTHKICKNLYDACEKYVFYGSCTFVIVCSRRSSGICCCNTCSSSSGSSTVVIYKQCLMLECYSLLQRHVLLPTPYRSCDGWYFYVGSSGHLTPNRFLCLDTFCLMKTKKRWSHQKTRL